jgi:hypothetical protein
MKWPQSKLKKTKPRIITNVLHDNSCNWIEQKPKKSTYQNENLNNLQNNYKSMVAMACLMPSSTCSRSLYTKSLPWTPWFIQNIGNLIALTWQIWTWVVCDFLNRT